MFQRLIKPRIIKIFYLLRLCLVQVYIPNKHILINTISGMLMAFLSIDYTQEQYLS